MPRYIDIFMEMATVFVRGIVAQVRWNHEAPPSHLGCLDTLSWLEKVQQKTSSIDADNEEFYTLNF